MPWAGCQGTDADLAPGSFAYRPLLAGDAHDQGATERLLVHDLHLGTGHEADFAQEGHQRRAHRAGERDHCPRARVEVVELLEPGDAICAFSRYREAMGAGGRPPERVEQALLYLLGKVVLETRREAVSLLPAVAEHVGQETLDDTVPAHYGGSQPPSSWRQLDTLVGRVLDQPPRQQVLHHGGGRRRRHPSVAARSPVRAQSPCS